MGLLYWDRHLLSSSLHLFLTGTLGAKLYDSYLLKRKSKLSKCWPSGWLLSLALRGTLRRVSPKHPVLRLRLAKMVFRCKALLLCKVLLCFQAGTHSAAFFIPRDPPASASPVLGLEVPGSAPLLLTLQWPRPWELLNRSLQHRLAEACWKFYPNPQTKKLIEFLCRMKLAHYSKPNSKVLFPVPGNRT